MIFPFTLVHRPQALATGLSCRCLKTAQGKIAQGKTVQGKCEHLHGWRPRGKPAVLGPAFDHCDVLVDDDLRGLTEIGKLYICLLYTSRCV